VVWPGAQACLVYRLRMWAETDLRMCLSGHLTRLVSPTFVQERNGSEASPESVKYTLAV